MQCTWAAARDTSWGRFAACRCGLTFAKRALSHTRRVCRAPRPSRLAGDPHGCSGRGQPAHAAPRLRKQRLRLHPDPQRRPFQRSSASFPTPTPPGGAPDAREGHPHHALGGNPTRSARAPAPHSPARGHGSVAKPRLFRRAPPPAPRARTRYGAQAQCFQWLSWTCDGGIGRGVGGVREWGGARERTAGQGQGTGRGAGPRRGAGPQPHPKNMAAQARSGCQPVGFNTPCSAKT